MFSRESRRNRELNKICMNQFLRDKSQIQFRDMSYVDYFTDKKGHRKAYVAKVGIFGDSHEAHLHNQESFFHEDLRSTDVPQMTWYCRADGRIWGEWHIRADKGTPLWNQEINWKNIQPHPQQLFQTVTVPMSPTNCATVNRFTKEHWVMHKLTSDTLL